MCSIIGAIVPEPDHHISATLTTLTERSTERGRDSWGITAHDSTGAPILHERHTTPFNVEWPDIPYTAVGNLRGEPTTEWVQSKRDADVQPFTSPSGAWTFTHNGTIANDHDLLQSGNLSCPAHPNGLPDEAPTAVDTYSIGVALDQHGFPDALTHLNGSFALLAIHRDHPGVMHWATNYKPLHLLRSGTSTIFCSLRRYLDGLYNEVTEPGPVQLGPYEYGTMEGDTLTRHPMLPTRTGPDRVLVICSGGLDSGTVAWYYHSRGHDVTLLHLAYGAKAEDPEVRAVTALGNRMGAPVIQLTTDFFSTHAISVLTDPEGIVNKSRGGEAGAELAHEWVPARNTVMIALAVAYAEKHGYNVIALGSNIEEGGAYPDNEMEFVKRWNDLVPFAVKPYTPIRIEDPCGPLVKYQIVALGAADGMPFDLTWSCYEGDRVHCGTCGPCAMRRKAFQMAGVPDPTEYEED